MEDANETRYNIDYTFKGLRDYLLLNDINRLYESMTTEELKGASAVIRIISYHLSKKYFEEEQSIDLHALIKTLEDLGDISLEMLIHDHKVDSADL